MGRHHNAEVVDITGPRTDSFPVIPAPRVSSESLSTPVEVPEPRGWRARRAARVEAAAAQERAVRIANAQRRARQVQMASRPVGC